DESACNDDAGNVVQSALDVFVRDGTSYLIEVTSLQGGGGTLHVSVDFTPAASCAAAPLAGCRVPVSAGTSVLQLKRGADPSGGKLAWKWPHGAATTLAEFGTPLTETGTSYVLCIYDASPTVIGRVRAPAGDLCGSGLVDCWRQRRSALAYKDRQLLP